MVTNILLECCKCCQKDAEERDAEHLIQTGNPIKPTMNINDCELIPNEANEARVWSN